MHIAIVDSNKAVTNHLTVLLKHRYKVTVFRSYSALLTKLQRVAFDFYILDWRVYPVHSLDLLTFLRYRMNCNIPVVFLTNQYQQQEFVAALEAGADDYLTKTVTVDELNAKLEAIMRRVYLLDDRVTPREIYGYHFSPSIRSISYSGQTIVLSEKQFVLAYFFFANAHRSLSRQELLMVVWGKDHSKMDLIFSRTLDVHVRYIRQKLGLAHQTSSVRLLSVHGFGYRLSPIVSLNAP